MLCHFYVVKSWKNMAGFPTLDLKTVKTPLTIANSAFVSVKLSKPHT